MSDRPVPSPHSFLLTLQSTQPPIRFAPLALSLDKLRSVLEAVPFSYHPLLSRLKSLETIPS
jgi:hypothetical protein